MSNYLGRYIQIRREELGLGPTEVAHLLGYKNLNKGRRRLQSVEDGRGTCRDFLLRLMGILQIEPKVIRDLIDRDRREYVAAWEKWADEPVPISVVMRAVPGFMLGIDVPGDLTTPEQALTFGIEMAKRKHKKVIVVVSRRLSYTIHENGVVDGPFVATPVERAMPYMTLGKTPFLFQINGSEKNH